MKVLIINQHSNNYGDDAAGCALIKMLLEKNDVEQIDIIYHAKQEVPITDSRVRHHLNISFGNVGHINFLKYYMFERLLKRKPYNRLLAEWIELINNSDMVFVSPSGANIGIYRDWPSLARILMVVFQRKTPIFHYNTIGKSGNAIFDFLARYALKRSIIYVREENSQKYLKSIGIESKWGPDTAFVLDKCVCTVRAKVISFIPSSFDGWHPEFKTTPVDKQIQNIVLPQIAEWVNRNNYILEIIPHLNTSEENEYNKIMLNELKNNSIKNAIIRDDINNVWDYDKAIGTSRMVIGMRYHSIVLAAKNHRPFLALCYENKMKEVCRYTNRVDCAVDIHQLTNQKDQNNLVMKLDYIKKNENDIVYSLVSVTKELIPLCFIPFFENRVCRQ